VTTPEVIKALAANLTPVSPDRTRNEVLLGLAAGGVVALVAVMLVFGVQPNLLSVQGGGAMAMKAAYTITLAVIAAVSLWPLLRPGGDPSRLWRLVAIPIVILAAVAAVQLGAAPRGHMRALLLGSSWQACPVRVAALSVPIFAGLCWAIRRQAPTRLQAAGAVAGLLSGAAAASLYALACTETGAGFVLIWYTLGIAVSTSIGALVGPRVLRW
jgi:hypothetical protein